MRISNKMFYKNIHASLQSNMWDMAELQQKVSSECKIHRPSDDPVTLGQLLDLNRNRMRTDKYVNSINMQKERLSRAETALTQATDLLMRAKDIVLDGSGGNMSKSSAMALAQEMDTLIDGMVGAASRTQGTVKFEAIFKRTTDADGNDIVEYIGNPLNFGEQNIDYEKIFDVELLNDTLNPEELFTPEGKEGIFETMIKVKNAFDNVAENGSNADDIETLSKAIGKLDEHFDDLLSARTGIGAKINRLDTLHVQLDDQGYSLNKSLVDLQSVDIAEAVILLSETMLTYHAALSATSRILQTGLVDYLS